MASLSTSTLTTLNGDTFQVRPDQFLETAKAYFLPEFDDDIHFVRRGDDEDDNNKYMMSHVPLETQTYVTIKQMMNRYQIDYRVLDGDGNEIIKCIYRIEEKTHTFDEVKTDLTSILGDGSNDLVDEIIQKEIDKQIERVKETEMEKKNNEDKKDEDKDENDKNDDEKENENKYDDKGFVWLSDPKQHWLTYPSFSELLVQIQKEGPIFGKTVRACRYESEFVRHRLLVEWYRYHLNQEFLEKQTEANQCSLIPTFMNDPRVANHPFLRLGFHMLMELNEHMDHNAEEKEMLPVFKHLINDEAKENYNASLSEGIDNGINNVRGIEQGIEQGMEACTIM